MPPSDLVLSEIGPESDASLRDLFELYCRDMAAWFDLPPGFVFDVPALWASGDQVYLAKIAATVIGFAVIGADEDVLDMREFFVIRGYRRSGAGRDLAAKIWEQHPGHWLVRVLEANTPAVQFWRTVIASYSGGAFREESQIATGSPWRYFRFVAP